MSDNFFLNSKRVKGFKVNRTTDVLLEFPRKEFHKSIIPKNVDKWPRKRIPNLPKLPLHRFEIARKAAPRPISRSAASRTTFKIHVPPRMHVTREKVTLQALLARIFRPTCYEFSSLTRAHFSFPRSSAKR